ncbi:hypothetical protein GCM10009868_39250 [Terrabacter aerolatus]|uniref:Lipoprotein n=1 Tax=Terrabacter aerolatus TaxID=422442 RepID=A0A512D0F1_9MICO|nr:hypothetical protein [Terrabacter aerolatus]GEO29942.1 hypothetical protein TAE01_17520 [Terrabacter aerolatus]
MGARAAALLAVVLAAGALAACGTTAAGVATGGSDTLGTGGSTGPPRASSTPTTSIAPRVGGSTSNRLGPVLAGIDPAKLPATATAVATVLGRLPPTLDGRRVTKRTATAVDYADGTGLETQPLMEAAGQGITMAQFWPHLVAGHPGDFTVTSHSTPGEPLLWLTAEGEPPYQAVVAAVASTTGSWVFEVEAPSEKAANDLLAALRAALA